MLSAYKQEIIWPDAGGGLDASALIPFELGGTMQSTKPMVSVMDLGKMLLHCAREGETASVRDLMSRGAPFTTDWLGTSPLHVAATNNHHDTCDALIKAGISKNARTKVDRTPLHFAVYEGHENIVRLLLQHDCEVDAKDMLRMTPLHWAVQKRHPRIVEQLLRRGADPSCRSKFDKTPLSLALETGQVDVYQDLLAAKMKIGDPEQQRAADSLVFELNRPRNGDDNDDDSEVQHVPDPSDEVEMAEEQQQPQTMDSMHVDEGSNYGQASASPMAESSRYSTSSDHLSDQDRLNANGIEMDESISRLAQSTDAAAGGCKTVDTSTLQILKDHGIAMLEDTDDTLLNSALQSGRRLVLSGAGKLILNDPKYKPLMAAATARPAAGPVMPVASSNTSPTKKTIFVPASTLSNGSNQIRFDTLRKKAIFMPSKSMVGGGVPTPIGTVAQPASATVATRPAVSTAAMPLKTNKVIKILTAEEFKEMCGAKAAAGSTLKKISTESFQKGALKYQTISNSNVLTHLARKKPIHKIKLGNLTPAIKSSMLNEIKITGIKPIGQQHHQLLQKLVPSTSTTSASSSSPAALHQHGVHASATPAGIVLDPDTEYISRLSQNQAKAAAAAAAAAQSASSLAQQRTAPAAAPAAAASVAVRTPMSQPDMERLLLDLRKQTDELRRRFELSQKQCEEYRVRLERLERERDDAPSYS